MHSKFAIMSQNYNALKICDYVSTKDKSDPHNNNEMRLLIFVRQISKHTSLFT